MLKWKWKLGKLKLVEINIDKTYAVSVSIIFGVILLLFMKYYVDPRVTIASESSRKTKYIYTVGKNVTKVYFEGYGTMIVVSDHCKNGYLYYVTSQGSIVQATEHKNSNHGRTPITCSSEDYGKQLLENDPIWKNSRDWKD